jgi:hypothetical protein
MKNLATRKIGVNMDNFLISIEYDSVANSYIACFADGETISLNSTNYQDAVLEADMLDIGNFEKGYN